MVSRAITLEEARRQREQRPPEKPRRNWFRILLRLVFFGGISAAFLAAWLSHLANEQKLAVDWITLNGGRVRYAYQYAPNGSFDSAADLPGPRWLRELLGVDFFSAVVHVDLSRTGASDVEVLAALESLISLDISNTFVTSLEPLSELKQLEYLNISGTQVATLSPLWELKRLKKVLVGSPALVGGFRGRPGYTAPESQISRLKRKLPKCDVSTEVDLGEWELDSE